MSKDFYTDYAERSDDELLHLASDRASLTDEAAAALQAELSRRKLTESDQAKYQKAVEHQERRDALKQRRRIYGRRSDRNQWVDLFWTLLAIALISSIYIALPNRYHMKPDWQKAAVLVMFTSVFIAVVGRSWWRKISFWMSLVLSSAIHAFVVHVLIPRSGDLSRARAELAILLGGVLFFAIYGFVWFLTRNFYGEEAPDRA
jgi:hypothetical protein